MTNSDTNATTNELCAQMQAQLNSNQPLVPPWWVQKLVAFLRKRAGAAWPLVVRWIFAQTFRSPKDMDLFHFMVEHVLTIQGWQKSGDGMWLSVVKPMPGEAVRTSSGTTIKPVRHANLCRDYEAIAKEVYFYLSAKAKVAEAVRQIPDPGHTFTP